MGLVILAAAGASYLLALRLAWSAVALGLDGRCEQVVVELSNRIVSTSCHRGVAQVDHAVASWVGVVGLGFGAFLALGLGSGLLLWAWLRHGRRDSAGA